MDCFEIFSNKYVWRTWCIWNTSEKVSINAGFDRIYLMRIGIIKRSHLTKFIVLNRKMRVKLKTPNRFSLTFKREKEKPKREIKTKTRINQQTNAESHMHTEISFLFWFLNTHTKIYTPNRRCGKKGEKIASLSLSLYRGTQKSHNLLSWYLSGCKMNVIIVLTTSTPTQHAIMDGLYEFWRTRRPLMIIITV